MRAFEAAFNQSEILLTVMTTSRANRLHGGGGGGGGGGRIPGTSADSLIAEGSVFCEALVSAY